MAKAAAEFDEALRNGWIRHDGDSGLRTHVLNAVRKTAKRWRYDRPPDAEDGKRRGRCPIDALTGVVMGHSVAVELQGDGDFNYVLAVDRLDEGS